MTMRCHFFLPSFDAPRSATGCGNLMQSNIALDTDALVGYRDDDDEEEEEVV